MTKKENLIDDLFGAIAGLFLLNDISTKKGSGKIVTDRLKEVEKEFKEKEKECDKYKQALNNIEEYFECKCKICRDKPELLDCSFCEHKTILDIINKAKDGNNDR